MGKNSLVKSTTKGKKSAAKKKAAKKTAAKAKAAPKAKPAAKAAPAPEKKAVSVKDLLQKKFPVWKPEKLYKVGPEKADLKDVAAPPFVSGSKEEQKRIKELLMKKFDIAGIKAAAEKAAAEKAAAEKAAAEKAAAEKAAAEKAAAEKAAAEKAAAEKAAAEKAAAEKAAAEKAAAEKAAAEKAAAEKAAAEKAAAEKAAAEKAAAEKAAEPEVSVSYEPPDSGDTMPPDPMQKGMKYLAAALAVLILLVIGSSMINQGKYYIHSTDGALEIFQGRFAPMGEELLISLPGVQAPEKVKDIYSKTDVYPIIFNYYLDKADTFLKVPGLPDFEGIKKYLNKAMVYKTTPDTAEAVYSRLDNINLLILLYKADVAASKSTLSDLKEAKGFLSEAARLDIDDMKLDLIHEKMDAVDKKIASLKAEQKAATSTAPAPQAETKSPAPAPHAEAKSPAPAPASHAKPHGE